MCRADIDHAAGITRNLQTCFHDASTLVDNLDLTRMILDPEHEHQEEIRRLRTLAHTLRSDLLILFSHQFGTNGELAPRRPA